MNSPITNRLLMGGAVTNRGLKTLCAIAFGLAASFDASVTYAMPPVSLTSDKRTKLDLTVKPMKGDDLLGCPLRIEEDGLAYFLVSGSKRVPVPKHAVKQMQDGSWVEIAVNGEMWGLPVRAAWIHYVPAQKTGNKQTYTSSAEEAQFGTSVAHIFVGAPRRDVIARIHGALPNARLVASDDPGNRHVLIVLNPATLVPTTGYSMMNWHLSKWLRRSPLTQIDYECIPDNNFEGVSK